MIAFFALHQLGYGDIMLPVEACEDDDGQAVAQIELKDLLSHAPIRSDGSVYYDAVSCYNELGCRVKLFAVERSWVTSGDEVNIRAYET